VFSRGPVIRAEAAAADPCAAFDLAAAKLAERLRRAADRRSRHNGAARGSSGQLSRVEGSPWTGPADSRRSSGRAAEAHAATDSDADDGDPGWSPMVVHEKIHRAAPMTLDEALSDMELVGHDFYLFRDMHTGLPSVVYRRCGYDYGLIRLEVGEQGDPGAGAGQRDHRINRDERYYEAHDVVATA
jgi:hypothetical protein